MQYEIGTNFLHYSTKKMTKIVDRLTVTNVKGEIVKVSYVTVSMGHGGQPVKNYDTPATTIARSKIIDSD